MSTEETYYLRRRVEELERDLCRYRGIVGVIAVMVGTLKESLPDNREELQNLEDVLVKFK